MTNPTQKNRFRAAGLVALLLVSPLPLSLQGCTDLSETPQSSITPENFYKNQTEVLSGLASVYAKLRNTIDDYYNASEVSTDEIIVPIRGVNWNDNFQWIDLHHQTYSPTNQAGSNILNGAWNNQFEGIARANVVLAALNNSTIADKPVITAELRTLRAFYYYMLMDLFGGVPIVTEADNNAIKPRARATRAETFKFIEDELKAARADLPVSWPASNQGRLTKGGADAILANMYLNAEVFTGTVTEAGLQKGAARWQDAIDAADRVLNAGVYSLNPNWRANFAPDNDNSPENVLVIKFLAATDLGLNFEMRTLHYSQLKGVQPWNGFSTLAETYNAFDAADQRRQIFLIGPQNNQDTGEPAELSPGVRLVFTPDIGDEKAAADNAGIRVLKYPVDVNHVGTNMGNDYAWFRLGEMYLIKAEAQFRLGQTGAALNLINTLRARVFTPPKPLTSISLDAIYNERLFELMAEGKRRQDMIRFDKFLLPFGYKPNTSLPYKVLMPIPDAQIQTNPLLEQNKGY